MNKRREQRFFTGLQPTSNEAQRTSKKNLDKTPRFGHCLVDQTVIEDLRDALFHTAIACVDIVVRVAGIEMTHEHLIGRQSWTGRVWPQSNDPNLLSKNHRDAVVAEAIFSIPVKFVRA